MGKSTNINHNMSQVTRARSTSIKYNDQYLKKVSYDKFCTLKINNLSVARWLNIFLTIKIYDKRIC